MRYFKFSKWLKIKFLFGYYYRVMLGKMIQEWGTIKFCSSCNYSCTLYYFGGNSIIEKLNNLTLQQARTLMEVQYNLNQKCNGCKGGGIYQNF